MTDHHKCICPKCRGMENSRYVTRDYELIDQGLEFTKRDDRRDGKLNIRPRILQPGIEKWIDTTLNSEFPTKRMTMLEATEGAREITKPVYEAMKKNFNEYKKLVEQLPEVKMSQDKHKQTYNNDLQNDPLQKMIERLVKFNARHPNTLRSEWLNWLDIIPVGAAKHGHNSYLNPDNNSMKRGNNFASIARHAAQSYLGGPAATDEESGFDPKLHAICRLQFEYSRDLIEMENLKEEVKKQTALVKENDENPLEEYMEQSQELFNNEYSGCYMCSCMTCRSQ